MTFFGKDTQSPIREKPAMAYNKDQAVDVTAHTRRQCRQNSHNRHWCCHNAAETIAKRGLIVWGQPITSVAPMMRRWLPSRRVVARHCSVLVDASIITGENVRFAARMRYIGASEAEILAGEMRLHHQELEEQLDSELPFGETVIAWALLRE